MYRTETCFFGAACKSGTEKHDAAEVLHSQDVDRYLELA